MPLLRRSLVCQQVVELVTEYLEGTMPAARRRRFESHLRGCSACSEYVAQIRATIELTGQVGQLDAEAEELTPEQEAGFVSLFQEWNKPE